MKKKKNTKSRTTKKKKNIGIQPLQYLPWLIAFLILVADSLTKYQVHTELPRMNHESQWYPYNGIPVFENFMGIEFSIVHAINYGAAWGILSDFQEYLLIFRIIFIGGLAAYLFFYNKNKRMTIPLTMILAGAFGNILDYFLYGHVVDMLKFVLWGYHYPMFNLADSSIFLGICGIFWISSQEKDPKLCKT